MVNSNWSYNPDTLNSCKKWAILCTVWPWNFMDGLDNQKDTSSILHQTLCIISKPWVNSNWSYSPETLFRAKIGDFLSRVTLNFDRWLWKTIDKAHLLCFFKLCASFQSLGWIWAWVTDWKHSIWVKIGVMLSRVTLKFDRWPWKINNTPLIC